MEMEKKPFDLQSLMSGEIPGDITLGTLKDYFYNGEERAVFQKVSTYPGKDVKIFFVGEDHRTELPDDTTLEKFRNLCENKLASIVIDDGSGGLGIRAPQPELV